MIATQREVTHLLPDDDELVVPVVSGTRRAAIGLTSFGLASWWLISSLAVNAERDTGYFAWQIIVILIAV